jgi:hypothetical protein
MYGWGWFRLSASGDKEPLDYTEVDRAGEFHIRAHRFFTFQGELRGVVGKVEQPGHLFDGLWATTWTMSVGVFDLTERLCGRWDSEFGPDKPGGSSETDWPTEPVRNPAYFGFGGTLAVSHQAIEAWRAANMTERSATPGTEPDPAE